MASSTRRRNTKTDGSQPILHQEGKGKVVQEFGALRELPIALEADVRGEVVQALNPILADTRVLRDLYKKVHWHMRGATFYQLHLLMDKHADEQTELIDLIAERVQTLGGVAVGDPRHVAEITTIPRPPDGAEEVPAELSRLLDGHETIIGKARELAGRTDELEDYATNDLLASSVLPVNEREVWFVAEHLVDLPLVKV